MIQPVEMREPSPVELHHGATATTTEIWQTLVASYEGDLPRVRALVSANPPLLHSRYDYTTPLHFAVREGHLDLVRDMLDQGALDVSYRTHPYMDTLVTLAREREHDAIAQLLEERLSRPDLPPPHGDLPERMYNTEDERGRFQRAVTQNDLATVEAMLQAQPALAFDERAFWGEGVLMMPAKGRHREMIDLLMRHGARVPAVSKWGREYYFKHVDMAAFLLERGMSPNHMTWRLVTLLHDMAQLGLLDKARLLLDHGADLDPIDEEYRSTPLGWAARWGHADIVDLLLERGADPNKAGARWAHPLRWAETKGHTAIADTLRRAGARLPA